MLVGERIISCRGAIPDPTGTLAPPVIATPTTSNVAGHSVPPGTYFLLCTQRNLYGESLGSDELTVTVTSPNNTISFVYNASPAATVIRAYLTLPGGASGSEMLYVDNPITELPIGIVLSITALPLTSSIPPTRSSAFLPDSDGKQYSAATLFRWLSQGLSRLSYAVGGILDYCGVPTVAGQPLYVVPGQWLSISDVWYGGYWIQGGNRADFFRRNTVTSNVLQAATISITAAQQVIEVTYQPDRNSGLTSTTGAIGTTAVGVGIANPGAFLLPFGFAQFGVAPNNEIVAYSSLANNAMSGLIRGIGNTVAQSWPIGTLVTELSLFWNGRRIFNTDYQPGQSALSIPAPLGWETILDTYMLAQAKKADQDLEGWQALEKDAFARANEWLLGNKGVVQRVQVGEPNWPIVYADTVAGGLLVP